MNHKLKSISELKNLVAQLKHEGKVIVFTNGCFDLLHVGHIRYLKAAKTLGDVLIVAVNSDRSVQALKGTHRPIMNQMDRIEILSALEFIDFIVLFDENDVKNLLLNLKPHIQAKGTDYTVDTVPEKNIVFSYGGKVCIAGDDKNHSTRDILKKIKILYSID